MYKYNYEILNIDLSSAIVDREINVEGTFISHISGSDSISIKLDDRAANSFPLTPTNTIEMPSGISFKKFYISGSGGGGTVQIFFGKPTLKITTGQVYISGSINTDNETEVIAASLNNHFTGGYYQLSTTSVFANVGLWNPSGSGVTLYLYAVKNSWGFDIGSYYNVRHFIDAITLLTVDTGFDYSSNLKAGGSNPLARIVYGQLTAVQHAAILVGAEQLDSWNRAVHNVSTPVWEKMQPAICIPEGYGYLVRGYSAGADSHVQAAFQWFEK